MGLLCTVPDSGVALSVNPDHSFTPPHPPSEAGGVLPSLVAARIVSLPCGIFGSKSLFQIPKGLSSINPFFGLEDYTLSTQTIPVGHSAYSPEG